MTNEERLAKALEDNATLRMQLAAYQAMEASDIPTACWWLQRKVDVQRKALDRLHTRVLNQRFVLRALEELGRGLTAAEVAEARARVTDEFTLSRLDPAPA